MGFSLMCPSAQAATFDYRGICDASAAVALDADHFVVADDESNKLFIYRRGESKAETDIDLTKSLKLDPKDEVDLEGAARIGDRIYWIASHSKKKKERRRFFATEIVGGSTPTIKEPNTFSKDLVKDMIAAPELAAFDLKSASKRTNPEMKDALNIEGLAATPDGDLLIGFRNPIPEGKALIVPLKNPYEVLEGRKAKFGAPVELDLGGRGIRAIERVGPEYLIVAGPYNDCGSFALYRWPGNPGDEPKEIEASDELDDLHPEALFAIPGTDQVQILSDDGAVEVGFRECNDHKKKKPHKMGFRSRILPLP
jgi:Protein of unknown function (DUF3616)